MLNTCHYLPSGWSPLGPGSIVAGLPYLNICDVPVVPLSHWITKGFEAALH